MNLKVTLPFNEETEIFVDTLTNNVYLQKKVIYTYRIIYQNMYKTCRTTWFTLTRNWANGLVV